MGKVWVNGIDVCLKQVKAGFAWHYKKYQHEQSPEDQRLYADAEDQARAERLGLWRDRKPTPLLVGAEVLDVESYEGILAMEAAAQAQGYNELC